jgi:hypothetical protein
MSLTNDNLQAAWILQKQQVNPRYSLMSPDEQAAFNANLLTIYNEASQFIMARYSGGPIDFGITPSVDPSVNTTSSIPMISLNIGVDINGNPITVNMRTTNQLYVTQVNDGGATNSYNFYSGDNVDSLGNHSPNLNGLLESWEYDDDPLRSTSNRIFIRNIADMTTWDESQPDQFAPNKYFLIGNTWISKLDPTQTFVWVNGVPRISNGIPIDTGLAAGKYDPAHPELINPEWNLLSHTGNQWIWEFPTYPDTAYVIKITQQIGGSYKHTFNSTMLTINQWFTKYVGTLSSNATITSGINSK